MGQLTSDSLDVPIVDLALTKDGRCLLVACSDNALRLLDNDNGDILATYKGHVAEDFLIECGILSSDSQVVSGSAQGAAVVWDLADEKEVRRMKIGMWLDEVDQQMFSHLDWQNIIPIT